jgi:hypothetical protein
MNGSVGRIPLQNQNARSFPKLRIILNCDRSVDAAEYINHKYTIVSKFVIAVVRDTNFALRCERLYSR